MADISTVNDTFNGSTLDLTKWEPDTGFSTVTVSGGIAHIQGHSGELLALGEYSWADGKGTAWEISLDPNPYAAWNLQLNNGGYVSISIQKFDDLLRAGFSIYRTIGGAYGESTQRAFDYTNHRCVRLRRLGYAIIFEFAPSMSGPWTQILSSAAVSLEHDQNFHMYLGTGGYIDVVQVAGVDIAPVDPPDPPEPPIPGDEFDPDAQAPEVPTEQCATVLDLIREFSGLVKRAVRLTGPTSIEMVDPATPLPAGWTTADADSLYSTTTHQLTAGAQVLSLLAGDLTMSANAALVTNDARLVTSTWRIPDRLPLFGLTPAPVKRVTMTFTPRACTASVEYHVPAIPLEVRRT